MFRILFSRARYGLRNILNKETGDTLGPILIISIYIFLLMPLILQILLHGSGG